MYKYQPLLESLRLKCKIDIKKAFWGEEGLDIDLNLDGFQEILETKLPLKTNLKDVQSLFYQIDVYNKGRIKYRNLADYLEIYEERRLSKDDGPFHTHPIHYHGVRCQDSIFEWTVYEALEDAVDEVSGNYVSLSRTGVLAFWRRDLKKHFETTIAVQDDGEKMTTMATGLACLPKFKIVAVATTAADIRFFNASTYKFEHKFSIAWLPAVIVNMDCYNSEKIACGDFMGSVYIVNMFSEFFMRLRRRASHLGPQKITFDDLKNGRINGIKLEHTAKSHLTNVAKVRYMPNLRIVVSCAVSSKRAMLIHHLDQNESLSFYSEAGISCFDYCEKLSCVVTGCIDNSVKIWNPAVNASCYENLTGHFNSVTHVAVDEKCLFVISADRDKTIRVWNLLRPMCLQVIKFKEADFAGKHIFATLFLDKEYDKLIITTNRITVLNLRRKDVKRAAHPDSELVVLATYNTVFDSFITVGNKASVAVWSAETCSQIHEFTEIHVTSTKEGILQIVDVVAAGLEPSERRLITAGRDGSIKVWNFHMGICLKEFQAKFPVMTLSFLNFDIFAAGSSGLITQFYDDGEGTIEDNEWKPLNEETIVSIDNYGNNLVASASSEGEIVIWLWKNVDAKLRMKDRTIETEHAEDLNDYPAKKLVAKRRRFSISQILFLRTRELDDSIGNLVSCGIDGRIRFWNVIYTIKVNKWKLLSKFRAVIRKSDGVLCIGTDKKNSLLFSGDTMGYVRVYDLEDYYSVYGSVPTNAKKPESHHYDKYPFLRLQRLIQINHRQYSKFDHHDEAELGFAPILLNCFRAHMGAILKVGYSDEREIIITAARQGSIRLWTVSGMYIGYLGSDDAKMSKMKHMPPDIQNIASPTTLH
ncbi:WD repeat-containing protein on Y chromosome, partial [Caerostris darwini]